ncbi:MAG: hypothetical protein MJY75_04105, partial [Bacteroidaceae bacterium]|nr:hypothetical protein [Bacteroidaceae bacterium]
RQPWRFSLRRSGCTVNRPIGQKIEVVPIILADNTGGHTLIGYLCRPNNILQSNENFQPR